MSSRSTTAASWSPSVRTWRLLPKMSLTSGVNPSGYSGTRNTRLPSPIGGTRMRARSGLVLVTVLAMFVAGCGSDDNKSSSGTSSSADKQEGSNLPQKIGAGEGALTLVAWEGYTQPDWVKPFEKETGCDVKAKYAGSSDEMVTLMRQGGGSQYDMVSASGDASVRLIRGGNVQPVNVDLIPSYTDFIEELKSPEHNTVDGKHYGVSLQWGPNTLLYNTKEHPSAPASWKALYDPANKGKVTVPDNPIQIADAALYLSKTQPDLGIEDPYALNEEQFNAAVELLK